MPVTTEWASHVMLCTRRAMRGGSAPEIRFAYGVADEASRQGCTKSVSQQT